MLSKQPLSSIAAELRGRTAEWAIALLLLLMYAPLVVHWFDGWLNKSISIEHEYFSHGVLGIPFAGYLIWTRRDRWRQLPNAAHPAGLVLLAIGILFYTSSMMDLINLSLPLVLAGLCLWFKGSAGLKLQAFPLVLILLSTPNELPYLIAPYTLPLQRFIAGAAGFILWQFGVDVTVNQIYLYVNDRIVEVAPYCAGLKMLFTSLYAGMMLAYWTGAWVSRLKMVAFFSGIIVISVAANVIRNTLLTYLHGSGQDAVFDWLHEGWGGDLYSALMLGSLVLLLRIIDSYEVDNPADEHDYGIDNRES